MVKIISFRGQTIHRWLSIYLSGTRSETAALDLSEHLSCERHGEGTTCRRKTDERGDEQEVR